MPHVARFTDKKRKIVPAGSRLGDRCLLDSHHMFPSGAKTGTLGFEIETTVARRANERLGIDYFTASTKILSSALSAKFKFPGLRIMVSPAGKAFAS